VATELIAPYDSVAPTRAGVTPVLPAYDGEPIYLYLDYGNVGTAVVYTVPADHILYLFNWTSRLVSTAATNGSAYAYIRNATAAQRFNFGHMDTNIAYRSQFVIGCPAMPLTLPPAWDIAITVTAANHYCSFSGYGILCDMGII